MMLVLLWLWQNYYFSDETIRIWSKLIGVLDSQELKLENFGLIYPHATYFILTPFHYLGSFDSPLSSYFVTVLFASGLIVLWNRHLRLAGHEATFRSMMILLIVLHPAVLWSATSGTLASISLICFYLLYISTIKMIYKQDIHAFMTIGVVLAVFYFVDEVTLYLFIALIPLLVMIVPRVILINAPASAYVILATPLLVVVLGWMYFNWIFYGSALAFVNDPNSGFLGGRHHILDSQWLRTMGGSWAMPLVYAVFMLIICHPVILLLLAQIQTSSQHFNAAIVLLLHPIVAIGFATYDFFLSHPLEIIFLVIAGVMAELTIIDARKRKMKWMILGALFLGMTGSWLLFLWQPTPSMQQWTTALAGVSQPDSHKGDRSLGKWLQNHDYETLIDDRSAFRVMVAQGNARNLIMPFEDQFKIELRRTSPTAPQIAIPDPNSQNGRRDRINNRWPELFDRGTDQYKLVYDHQGWRVWRRYES